MSTMLWAISKPGRIVLVGTKIYVQHVFIPHASQLLFIISDNGRVLSTQSLGLESAKLFAEVHALATAATVQEMAS